MRDCSQPQQEIEGGQRLCHPAGDPQTAPPVQAGAPPAPSANSLPTDKGAEPSGPGPAAPCAGTRSTRPCRPLRPFHRPQSLQGACPEPLSATPPTPSSCRHLPSVGGPRSGPLPPGAHSAPAEGRGQCQPPAHAAPCPPPTASLGGSPWAFPHRPGPWYLGVSASQEQRPVPCPGHLHEAPRCPDESPQHLVHPASFPVSGRCFISYSIRQHSASCGAAVGTERWGPSAGLRALAGLIGGKLRGRGARLVLTGSGAARAARGGPRQCARR